MGMESVVVGFEIRSHGVWFVDRVLLARAVLMWCTRVIAIALAVLLAIVLVVA
ncbi:MULTISPECIES: hypothetical protein [unclassified Bartonella]|uniref:hypothetical protein n=1 Tax=unclassified Bartonella TaxID=2645622 RepID=UPI0035D05AED